MSYQARESVTSKSFGFDGQIDSVLTRQSAVNQLAALIESLAAEKALRRRHALTTQFMFRIIALSGLAATAILLIVGSLGAAVGTLIAAALVGFAQARRAARLPGPIDHAWLGRAIEVEDMTGTGREQLTELLLMSSPSAEQALRWARDERRRQLRMRSLRTKRTAALERGGTRSGRCRRSPPRR